MSGGIKLRFRSKKNLSVTPTESLVIDSTASGGNIRSFAHMDSVRRTGSSAKRRKDMFVKMTGGVGDLRAADTAKVVDALVAQGKMLHVGEIAWDKRVGKFYLIVKRVAKREPDSKALADRDVLAFDPGVRVFQAFSMPDGTHGQLLRGAESHMRDLCSKISDLHAKYDRETEKWKGADGWDPAHLRRQTLRGRLQRARARLRNWMKNMHYESINHVLDMADVIILPVFQSQRMARRAGRVFGNSVARDLYTWSHYSFSQRLYYKAQIMANKAVIFTDEPGTTKTCDACGHVQNVGSSKLFACELAQISAVKLARFWKRSLKSSDQITSLNSSLTLRWADLWTTRRRSLATSLRPAGRAFMIAYPI